MASLIFFAYEKILEDYESGKSTNLNRYLEILEYFTEHKYFNLRDAVVSSLEDFGISPELAQQPMKHLSGGQKRYVEMTRMMFSQADILLIDEPTNHMDYRGKRALHRLDEKHLASSCCRYSRQRRAQNVSKNYWVKDQKMHVFKGNYNDYIKQMPRKHSAR